MAIPKFLEDLLIISKLGDNPGTDNGLTSSGLREKFDEAGVKTQKYINETLIPALSGLSNPEEGLNMKNDIAMGGHRVTGLGEPVADGDAVPRGYANGHYAPAGYGLGGAGKLLSSGDNLDDIWQTGNYWWSSAPVRAPMFRHSNQYCHMRVDGASETEFVQTVWSNHPAGDAGYCQTRYSYFNANGVNTIGEWEWVNPPMVPGVEYRTTERYNGKHKYVKAVECGTIPSNTDVAIAYSDDSNCRPISAGGGNTNGSVVQSGLYSAVSNGTVAAAYDLKIGAHLNYLVINSVASVSLTVNVEYFKTTD